MMHIPDELLEQFERGNVLLFVGERIVRDADGQAWIDHLTAQLAARCKPAGRHESSFAETAQDYEYEQGRQALVQFVRDQLEAQGNEPQPAHRLIAGLRDCDVLATTCLDRRLERAFEQTGRPLNCIVGGADVAFEDERKARLYRLRGSPDQPESLVLTEEDHERFFEDQSSISVVLQGYLARKTILFVGYDLADPHFKRLYRKVTIQLDKYMRRAYVFGESLPQRICRWCEDNNIQVVPADATAFLQALSDQLAARARPAEPVPSQLVESSPVLLPQRPYKLLDYYEAQDAGIFFGREAEIRELVSRIHAHRLTLLYGASGTGKTSLLLAGAAPRLERADPPYATLHVRALEDPAVVIRRQVRLKLPDAALPEGGSLVDFLAAATRALGCPLVVFLDQFEEFFIRLSPEYRQAFIVELGALHDARALPVKVVICLREDWLASINEIEQCIPEVFHVKMRLLPLTREQARQSIILPAERMGVGYEPALVDELLQDLGGEGTEVLPPQLQLVCDALYSGLKPAERTITLAAYNALGGARGVLQAYLDGQLARLPGGEQALARDVLAELVTSERTKAVKTGDELALALGVQANELLPVLEKLVHARLLRPMEREQGRAYELAHEYLIAEIALGPEAVARKEAEELLRQGVDNWGRFGALLSAETFALIDAQRERLRLNPAAQELLLRSALRYGQAVGYWLGQAQDEEAALALAEETLLTEGGEPARRALGAGAGAAPPDRLRALVTRLTNAWRKGKEVRVWASDALWALRRHLPRPLRLRLAASRSPRLLKRLALPLAAALAVALLFVAILWGPRLWTPKPPLVWVEVPAGPFLMGSDPTVDEYASGDEQPQHTVTLDAYRIGRYEVTNAEYAQCVKATVCNAPGELIRYSDPAYAEHPVVYVSWSDARTFCAWVGGRLPTEAEWEKAARGTDGRIYPWGNQEPDCDKANYFGCGKSDTSAVGSYPAGDSPYGAADMAGNVWEWVADGYGGDYYGAYPVDGWPDNPTGPEGLYKVLRGGGWARGPANLRAAYRYFDNPAGRDALNGFRCVRAPGR